MAVILVRLAVSVLDENSLYNENSQTPGCSCYIFKKACSVFKLFATVRTITTVMTPNIPQEVSVGNRSTQDNYVFATECK